MGINKVQYGNTTLIDLTEDTVTADKLMQGYTAHDRSGAIITGTATGGGTGAISVVDTEDTHGGTIRTITAVDISDTTAVANDVAQGKYFYTADGTKTAGTSSGGGGGGGTWTWMGEDPYRIYTWSDKKFLKDTSYATWTPSTTAIILEDTTALDTLTLDLSLYEYIIISKFHSHFEYGDGAEQTGLAHEYYAVSAYGAYGKPHNLNNMTNDIGTLTGSSIMFCSGLFYINTSGAEAYSASTSYGVFAGGTVTPSITSSSSKITLKNFKINAKCNEGYFSTTNAEAVDQTASYYEQSCEMWRINKKTAVNGAVANYIRDMWVNGF